MREIKFNLWDIEREQYFKDVLSLKNNKIEKWATLEIRTSNNVKWLQYTGLKDKNGVEIYEGDVLKITNGWNDTEYITKVRYESNVFCIDVQGFDYNVTPLGYLDEECITEVIGNIHENPELLN